MCSIVMLNILIGTILGFYLGTTLYKTIRHALLSSGCNIKLSRTNYMIWLTINVAVWILISTTLSFFEVLVLILNSLRAI